MILFFKVIATTISQPMLEVLSELRTYWTVGFVFELGEPNFPMPNNVKPKRYSRL